MDPFPQNPDSGITGVLSIRRQIYRTGVPGIGDVELYERSGFAMQPNGTVLAIQETACSHALACSCTPRNLYDLAICQESGALVCRTLHAGECAVCGHTFSIPFLTVRSTVYGQRVLLCTRCVESIETPTIIKWWRWLRGKWGCRD